MVVNDDFIREGHLGQLSPLPGQVIKRHSTNSDIQTQLNKNISLL